LHDRDQPRKQHRRRGGLEIASVIGDETVRHIPARLGAQVPTPRRQQSMQEVEAAIDRSRRLRYLYHRCEDIKIEEIKMPDNLPAGRDVAPLGFGSSVVTAHASRATGNQACPGHRHPQPRRFTDPASFSRVEVCQPDDLVHTVQRFHCASESDRR
jgi:hypothetical protein